ncbi:MAG: hypothetical protein J6A88_10060 [Oscillospiraceae bacterium]|nr:hypothetical protein [Oscillospiraceae bacterium]
MILVIRELVFLSKKNQWILFGVAIVLIAINLINADFSVFAHLSPGVS